MPYGMPAPQPQQEGFLAPGDPLVAVGTTMLRQSGATYLESGKRYMQSWTGVLSGARLQHEFDISASYGALAKTLQDSTRLWNNWSPGLLRAFCQGLALMDADVPRPCHVI